MVVVVVVAVVVVVVVDVQHWEVHSFICSFSGSWESKVTWLDNITMANSECNYLQVANGGVKPSSHLNARDTMEGPRPYFRLLCAHVPQKQFLSTFLLLRPKNNSTTDLWGRFLLAVTCLWVSCWRFFFVLGRWRNSGKRTKPSKKRFAQGSRPAFYMSKSHERMTTWQLFFLK